MDCSLSRLACSHTHFFTVLPPRRCRHNLHRLTACRSSSSAEQKTSVPPQLRLRKLEQHLKKLVAEQPRQLAAGLLLAGALLLGTPAIAADVAKTGQCLLGNCQVQLAKCLGDGECLENLVCLQLCNNKTDETACQIRCGDLYNDKAIQTFNACAVSDKKCVPQRVDVSAYPEPPADALDREFDLSKFDGRWYITAGLNPLFDTFDCQEHYFGVPEPGKLYGKINWRIPKPGDDFIERSTVQQFKQVPGNPAMLENHGNDYLHYEDDWYILASKPNEYVLIYYRGNNDAWKGYGGATVYTRAPLLPEKYVPELEAAAKKAGLDWADFVITDNSCPPHPPKEPLYAQAEELAEEEARAVEYTLENDLKSFGKGFTVLEKELGDELRKDEGTIEKELVAARDFLEDIELKYRIPAWLDFLPGGRGIFKNLRL